MRRTAESDVVEGSVWCVCGRPDMQEAANGLRRRPQRPRSWMRTGCSGGLPWQNRSGRESGRPSLFLEL